MTETGQSHPLDGHQADPMLLTQHEKHDLEETANDIRESIIEMLVRAGSGHTAGPLGMADVFTVLYFHTLRHDPKNPGWDGRDRLVLSNGHICPVLYTTMAYAGYFPREELKTLRKFGSRLQGHPHREFLPALETSSGPLGEGLSQAVGMAIADKMDGQDGTRRIYCLMSDGELEEDRRGRQLCSPGSTRCIISLRSSIATTFKSTGSPNR